MILTGLFIIIPDGNMTINNILIMKIKAAIQIRALRIPRAIPTPELRPMWVYSEQ